MIDTIAKPEVDVDPALVADVEDALSPVNSITLADLLREGSGMVKQVTATFSDGVESGCALTAISAAATARNIQF